MLAAVDFEGGLENAWDSIITWVPKLLGFLLILGIGYFIAKAIEKVIDGILERVGFDRLVERGGLRTALSRSKLDASSILARIVFYVVFLFVLQLAFGISARPTKVKYRCRRCDTVFATTKDPAVLDKHY